MTAASSNSGQTRQMMLHLPAWRIKSFIPAETGIQAVPHSDAAVSFGWGGILSEEKPEDYKQAMNKKMLSLPDVSLLSNQILMLTDTAGHK